LGWRHVLRFQQSILYASLPTLADWQVTGPSQTDAYSLAGTYAARILKGEKPGDMPIQRAAKFELVINLKPAKVLGLTVPMHLQQIAEIIE
jgi:putative ABC transport system substrate-binding protein